MPMAAFDTLGVAKRLHEEFGVPDKQAEGISVVLHENFVGNVATKDDLARVDEKLTGKIEALDEKLTGKIEALDEKLTGKIEAQGQELGKLEERITMKITIRLGGLIIGALGFFEVLNRAFPITGE